MHRLLDALAIVAMALLALIFLPLLLIGGPLLARMRTPDRERPLVDRLDAIARRLRWSLKQLVPLTYRSTYAESYINVTTTMGVDPAGRTYFKNTGPVHFAVWRMWLGRIFDHTDVIVLQT
jgi:hypothetical protein